MAEFEESSVLSSASMFLASLNEEALNDLFFGSERETDSPKVVVAYIKRFMVANVPMAIKATQMLFKMADNAGDREVLRKYGGLHVLLKVVRKYYITNTEFTSKALKGILSLLVVERARKSFLKRGGVDLVKDCLESFVGKRKDLTELLLLIINLSSQDKHILNKYIDRGITEVVISSFDYYFPVEIDLIQALVGSMAILSDNNRAKQIIALNGGLSEAIDCVELFLTENPKIIKYSCDIMKQLAMKRKEEGIIVCCIWKGLEESLLKLKILFRIGR